MDTKVVEMLKKTLGALETNVASFTAHATASLWVFGAHFVPLLSVPQTYMPGQTSVFMKGIGNSVAL